MVAAFLFPLSLPTAAKSPQIFPTSTDLAEKQRPADQGLTSEVRAVLKSVLKNDWLDAEFNAKAAKLQNWRDRDESIFHEQAREDHTLKLLGWRKPGKGHDVYVEIGGIGGQGLKKDDLIARASQFLALPAAERINSAKTRAGNKSLTQLMWRTASNDFVFVRQHPDGGKLMVNVFSRPRERTQTAKASIEEEPRMASNYAAEIRKALGGGE